MGYEESTVVKRFQCEGGRGKANTTEVFNSTAGGHLI